jgi:hypothetical protein
VSTGDWVVVVVAGAILAVVVGVLATLPIWTRRGGPRVVPALLALQAGGVLVVGTVATAAAVRSWQIIDRPAGAHVARTLITVSHIDGDGSLYALIVLTVVAVAGLAAALLLVGARFAATSDPTERTVACAVLGVEIGLCGYGLAACIGGSRSAPALLSVVNLPLAMAAMVACWPPHGADVLPDSTA